MKLSELKLPGTTWTLDKLCDWSLPCGDDTYLGQSIREIRRLAGNGDDWEKNCNPTNLISDARLWNDQGRTDSWWLEVKVEDSQGLRKWMKVDDFEKFVAGDRLHIFQAIFCPDCRSDNTCLNYKTDYGDIHRCYCHRCLREFEIQNVSDGIRIYKLPARFTLRAMFWHVLSQIGRKNETR